MPKTVEYIVEDPLVPLSVVGSLVGATVADGRRLVRTVGVSEELSEGAALGASGGGQRMSH